MLSLPVTSGVPPVAVDRSMARPTASISRAKNFARFVDGLRPQLAPGIDKRTATDLLWAFSNEELWRELVEEQGWSPDRYEQWLARTLIAQLVTPAGDGPTAPPLKRKA